MTRQPALATCCVERSWFPQGHGSFSEPRSPPHRGGCAGPAGQLRQASSGDGVAQAGVTCPSGKRRSEAGTGAWAERSQAGFHRDRTPRDRGGTHSPEKQPGTPLRPETRPPLVPDALQPQGDCGCREHHPRPPPSSPRLCPPPTLAQAPHPVNVSHVARASGSSEARSVPGRAHPSPDPSAFRLCRDHLLPSAHRVGWARLWRALGK